MTWETVTITLPIHPLVGRELTVERLKRQSGRQYVMVEHPDGSRVGIPLDWTDRWPSVQRTDETDAWLNFGGDPYRRIDPRCWSTAARLVDMDRAGIAVQVISPIPVTFCYQAEVSSAAELAGLQNDFFARMIAEHPARFAALGAVPLQDPDLAVAELRGA